MKKAAVKNWNKGDPGAVSQSVRALGPLAEDQVFDLSNISGTKNPSVL